jgi:hypothetical protein
VTSGVPELINRTIRNVRQASLSYSHSGGGARPTLHPGGG